MSIRDNIQAIADDLMSKFGVPAVYRAGGAGDGVAVTVRCKTEQVQIKNGAKAHTLGISVRVSEVASVDYGDTFEIDGQLWVLDSTPLDICDIRRTTGGTLWDLSLTRDARPAGRNR
jgi:hypothetical protein